MGFIYQLEILKCVEIGGRLIVGIKWKQVDLQYIKRYRLYNLLINLRFSELESVFQNEGSLLYYKDKLKL
jgi:hypothetical protein